MKELADLTAAEVITRKLSEADVREQCVDWARRRGYWARKFSSQSQRSVPDYLFARSVYYAFTDTLVAIKFACEFKNPNAKIVKKTGVKSTEAQVDEQEAMRRAGYHVFECDNFEFFKAEVLAYEQKCGVLF